MAPGGPDLCRVTSRAGVPPVAQGAMSTPDLATSIVRGVAAAAMQILERFTRPPQANEADCPPVDLVADAAIWNVFRDAWLPLHGLHQPDRPLPVGHQHLTDWDTELWLPKKKISGHPSLK